MRKSGSPPGVDEICIVVVILILTILTIILILIIVILSIFFLLKFRLRWSYFRPPNCGFTLRVDNESFFSDEE